MQKARMISGLVLALTFVAAAVLWLLSAIDSTAEQFSWFGLPHAVALISGVWGTVILLYAIFRKGLPVPLKRLRVIIAVGMYVIMALCLANIWGWENQLILPIIAVVLTVGLLFMVFAVKGKRWDMGDNQKVGYKNYHQRKAEKESQEQAAKQQSSNEPQMSLAARIREKELREQQELRDLEDRMNQPSIQDEERLREERIREEERIRFDERVRIAEELKKNQPK
ncbi:MAG: hypothetical protein FWE22_00545 [Firmicutes bacterium]|nr:hypothetical protein [Bacillota bacterium]